MESSTDYGMAFSGDTSGHECSGVLRPEPVKIGEIPVSPPVFLAPMAGVTDEIYRSIAAAHGAGMVTTEMVSVAGLNRDQPETWRLCSQKPGLSVPLAVQIFGGDPEAAAEAARRLEATGTALIDINAGCPVRKVVRQGAGAGLLKDPDRLVAMVEKVRGAVKIPVTVKLRLGWDANSTGTVEMARRLRSAGADAITIHGRTAVQGYRGRADWTLIKQVKAAVDIPVIGNGDINSPSQADEMIRATGCDGVMIGRAAMGNPWLLSVIASNWGYRRLRPDEWSWMDFYETAISHFESFRERRPGVTGHLKAILVWYSRGCPHASRLRSAVCLQERADDMLALFNGWFDEVLALGLPFLPVKVPESILA
jgi:tRNA-dihydrouridine synthase B